MIRKKGNPLIQFLLSISPRFWIRLFKDQRSTSSQHVKVIRKKGNPLIQFLLSISPRFWIRLFKDQRSTYSQHVKMKGQSKQSKGLVKTEKAFRCNDPKGQMIQSFFSQVARKIQLQGSSYNSVIMDSLQRFFMHV